MLNILLSSTLSPACRKDPPPCATSVKRWRNVPPVQYDNLFVADGDLLHRSGPRFVDGVESLCAMLEQARTNRGKRG